MDWVILIAGIVGLLAAGYGLVTLVRGALRSHRYVDIAAGVAVAAAVIALLIAFGDRLVR